MVTVKPITLEIEQEIWSKFKEMIPRTIKLNDAVVHLIKDKVEANSK